MGTTQTLKLLKSRHEVRNGEHVPLPARPLDPRKARRATGAPPRKAPASLGSSERFAAKDVLLAVARTLPSPFTAAQLAVAAWSKHPERFCLSGFPEHPDIHRIILALWGRDGLVCRGLLESAGKGLLRVPEANP